MERGFGLYYCVYMYVLVTFFIVSENEGGGGGGGEREKQVCLKNQPGTFPVEYTQLSSGQAN